MARSVDHLSCLYLVETCLLGYQLATFRSAFLVLLHREIWVRCIIHCF